MCPEAKERIEQSVKVFSETGLGYFSVGNVELIGRRKDGSEFPAELSVSPVRFNGKWNAIGVVKDITKRKQADQKLREAEQRYHTLFNQAPIGVLVLDPETASFVEFNEVAHVQLGYNREEFEILTIFDIEDKESPQETRAHLKEIIENGGDEFGTLQRTKRGEARNVIVTARSFQSAGRTFIHCIFHDITEIVKVQNALAKSEAQYRQLVELAHEGIWAIDNDFTTIFVNPRMAQMLGYTYSELLGKSIFDFFGAGKVNTIKEFARKFDPERMSNSFEYAFLLKNGRRLDTSISLSIIADDQKQKVGLLAVVSDITQRKQVEKALKESGEISRAIVANAPIGIATSDKSYHFVTANEAFCKILGYTQAELRKLTFKDLTHPEDCAKSIENMTALEKGEVTSFQDEKRYFKKDGSIIDGKLIINAIRDSKGEPTLFVVQLEDVTKRKQLENDLRTSEERFRAMSTSAMDSIVLCDSEDIVLYWNPAAEKTFGYPANEVIGKKLADAVIPKTLHQNHARFVGGLSRNAPKRQFGLTALRKDGSRFPIDLSMTLVKLNGQDCFLSTIRDITEWKAMEEKIRRERDLLESVTASTDILLSIVGRDYRIIWANHKAKQTFHGSNIEGRHEIFGR